MKPGCHWLSGKATICISHLLCTHSLTGIPVTARATSLDSMPGTVPCNIMIVRRSLPFPSLYSKEAQAHLLHLCRAGRQLIYSLSQKHRNSLLLNYAIQRILQAGHEEEVASIGSSLASYFSVFHRLLTNRLKQVPQADAATLRSLATELKVRLCTVTCEIAKSSELQLPA